MDTTLPGTNSSLFNVPRLAEDGSNWITYKERALTAIGARGLMRYTDGRAKKPKPFELDSKGNPIKADKSAATEDEVEELENKIDEFFMKDSLIDYCCGSRSSKTQLKYGPRYAPYMKGKPS